MQNPMNCFKTNVIGTLNLIEFAEKSKEFIFASTQYDFNQKLKKIK